MVTEDTSTSRRDPALALLAEALRATYTYAGRRDDAGRVAEAALATPSGTRLLAALRRGVHRRSDTTADGDWFCDWCHESWPCPTAIEWFEVVPVPAALDEPPASEAGT